MVAGKRDRKIYKKSKKSGEPGLCCPEGANAASTKCRTQDAGCRTQDAIKLDKKNTNIPFSTWNIHYSRYFKVSYIKIYVYNIDLVINRLHFPSSCNGSLSNGNGSQLTSCLATADLILLRVNN